MNKRETLLRLAGQAAAGTAEQGYVPAAFFLHFDENSRQGEAAVAIHQEFFRFTGMDFVKIQYERPFPAQKIETPSDWAQVRPLDREFFEPQLEVVRDLVAALKSEAVIIVTLYSPFMCAGQVGGKDTLTAHLREDPEAVRPAMQAVTESLQAFVEECALAGVDGFYHSTQGGENRRFNDPKIFQEYVKPFDLTLMNDVKRRCRFNILHVCDYNRDQYGGYDDLAPFLDYPGQVVNCSLEVGDRVMTPAEISSLFGRPFMGGMDRRGAVATGTEEQIRKEAREVLRQAPPAFILGADCTVPNGTPWENLRIAIDEAHRGR